MSKLKVFCKDKVLEFLWRSHKGYENYIVPRGAYWSNEFELVIEATGEVSIWKPIKGGQDRAEGDLNPLYYEIIDEQECPDCEGEIMIPAAFTDSGSIEYCYRCSGMDGKVEVVTGFYVFGSREEYDEEVLADRGSDSNHIHIELEENKSDG